MFNVTFARPLVNGDANRVEFFVSKKGLTQRNRDREDATE